MTGAQIGKSEAILNIIGYHIENDPCPMLVLQPTLEMAQAFSKDRVASGLLNSTPCLKGKVKDPRARDSNNTTLHKVFPGGALTMVGANSPAGLASRPIRLVLCDEVDRYPTSAGSEGDPIHLARKRSATFWNRKMVMVSTPTNKDSSRIEQAFEASDRRYYYVPCKHCHHDQKLAWSNVRWDDGDPSTAGYMCEHCHVLWSDSDRQWAIRNGQWVAEGEFNGIAGFALSGLYSPWTPLADGVRDFLSVRKNPEQLRVWTNTYLGETWEDEGERIDDYDLSERREPMANVPDDVVVITAGADVQDNRIEITLVGWKRDDASAVLAHHTVYGDPSTPHLWNDVDSILRQTFTTESGREMSIRSACVDSGGHFTNSVYSYCKKNAPRRIFAIKGVGGEGKPIAGRPSKNNVAKCPLFPVGVDTVKDLIFARLRIREPGAGYIQFSDSLDDEYFRQLTAEKIVTRFHRGFKKRIFEKVRPRNEALDCMVYAIAAYAIIGINVNAYADKMERRSQQPIEVDEVKQTQRPRQMIPRGSGGFANSWR
jgi:phage terminase large subunit GpA-like protein